MEAVHQIVGPIPSWLVLGPGEYVDGVLVREVLGDWSHVNECDRPPRYILEDNFAAPRRHALDRSEDRPDVPQRFPGRDIHELRGRHSGRVAILFNGGTLADHDLHRIRQAGIPIIGMNRTHVGHPGYDGPDPDYICAIDLDWVTDPKIKSHPGFINGSIDKADAGYRATRSFRMTPFSLDLGRDGFVPFVPGTTGFLALQVAAYMGFTELWCVGLDVRGKHFDGTKGSLFMNQMAGHFHRMAPVIAAAGIKVYIAGSPNSLAPFEKRSFEELVA